MLTQSRVKELFDYHEDGFLIWKVDKGTARKGDVSGNKSHDYRQTMVDGVQYSDHQLIFLYHRGYIPFHIDHISRNKANSRIDNLRPSDKSRNAINSKIPSTNTSGVKGVSWDKQRQKWHSIVKINQKMRHLGRFEDFTEAVAHRFAAEQYLGWSEIDLSSSAMEYIEKYVKQVKS